MIWLIGCKGMLGTELRRLMEGAGEDVVGTDLDCDITRPEQLREFTAAHRPAWIVNCSAYTAVDKAEDEEAKARLINATGAGNIAAAAAACGARMIHISTDYVFDGTADAPYTEETPAAPAGAYGRTKAEGETLVRQACPRSFILRTAWLYGRHGNNFVATMLRLMRERPELKVVADQQGTPTWTRTLANVILELIRTRPEAFGTYHVTDAGQTTWHEFACEIQRQAVRRGLLPREIPVLPITTAEYPSRARRPAYSVLSKRKIQECLGHPLPDWRTSLEAYLDELARENAGLA